jgi:hypothetical protein
MQEIVILLFFVANINENNTVQVGDTEPTGWRGFFT